MFLGVVLVLCFSVVFCLGFCSYYLVFAPENVSKKFSSCQVCCFWGVCSVFCVFWCCFAYFLLYYLSSRKCLGKNSLDVRFFLGFFSLPLVFSFFLFFFFKRESSGSNRAHPHTHLVFLFLFLVFVPAAPGLSPVLAVRPFFLAFCRGAILGPGRFGVFLDSLGTVGGSRLLAPF